MPASQKKHPEKTCGVLGIMLAAALLLGGVVVLLLGSENLTLLIFGIFLMIAAVSQCKSAGKNAIRDAMQKSARLRGGEALEIRQIGVYKSTTVREVYKMLHTERCSIICVLDDDLCVIGSLDEGKLIQCMLDSRGEISVGDVIDL